MCSQLALVASLGLTGVLAGCGDDDATPDTSTAPTTSVETTVLPSLAQLDAMLLDSSDVGTPWQLGSEITDADLADATQIPCDDTAINPTIADRLTPRGMGVLPHRDHDQ
jgi:hypothetical protein